MTLPATVKIGNKEYPISPMNMGKSFAIQKQRFNVGDILQAGKTKKTIVSVRPERSRNRVIMWRYTFSTGWSRDMYKANTIPSLTLVGKASPDKLESEQSNLTARKSRKGNKLKELVNKGTLDIGMKVNVSSTKVGMLSGHIRDFNFTTGKILVELEPFASTIRTRNNTQWYTHVWIPGQRYSTT